jgi:hypothetical protein
MRIVTAVTLVSEQFAFHNIQRNGRAIELYESAPDALAGFVNGMRDEFLSRAGFPLDEDSRISGSHLFYLFEKRLRCGAIAANPRESSFYGGGREMAGGHSGFTYQNGT